MKQRMLVLAFTFVFLNVQAIEIESSLFGNNDKTKQVFRAQASGNTMSLFISDKNHGGTLSISGPDNYTVSLPFEQQSLAINLLNATDKLPSGRYQYHITAHIGELRLVQDTIDNGRGDENFTYAGTPVSYSGSFVVENGTVKTFSDSREEHPNEW